MPRALTPTAFILTRSSGDDTATPTTSDTSETQTTGNTEEGSEGGQEAGTPKCDTQEEVYSNPDCRDDGSPVSPVQQISCAADGPIYDLASDGSWIDENGVRQTACEAPTTPTGTLPANWNSLSVQEKTDLNPFDCDYDTQWVSAEDGTCIARPALVAATAPLQYVNDSISVNCLHPNEDLNPNGIDDFTEPPLRCWLDFKVAALTTIDRRQDSAGAPWITPGYTPSTPRGFRRCSVIKPEFIVISRDDRVYGFESTEEKIDFACFNLTTPRTSDGDTGQILIEGDEAFVSVDIEPVLLDDPDTLVIHLQTTPETTLTEVEIRRVKHALY